MRVYSVQVDDQMAQAVEEDRARISAQMGQPLTVSQYLRLVLHNHLGTADPIPAGVAEGIKLGLGRFLREMHSVAERVTDELVRDQP